MEEITRRQVLGTAVKLTVAGATVAGLAGCSAWQPREARFTSGLVAIGSAGDCPPGTVSTDYLEDFGVALANDGGAFLAIHPKCTHLGCYPVPWNAAAKQFQCPCHGSQYDIRGQVVRGPAQRAMRSVVVKPAADGALAVDLGQLFGG